MRLPLGSRIPDTNINDDVPSYEDIAEELGDEQLQADKEEAASDRELTLAENN